MKIKKICSCIILLLLIFSFSITVNAQSAYESYNYTVNGEETASPDIFTVKNVLYGSLLSCGSFEEAQDIFVDEEDNIYLLDSLNARVLIFDSSFNFVKELKDFQYNDEIINLAVGAEGLFYNDSTDKLFIADTNNNRILVCDTLGVVYNIFEKPNSVLLDESFDYKPTKIIVDNNSNMYIISKNINTGAIMTDSNNEFIGFYGINDINETFSMKIERLWQKILKGASADYSFQPVAINNLFWAKNRFVYSVSTRNEYLISEVCKLNALGENVLKQTEFADIAENEQVEVFDITVDENGFFSILDRYNSKVYCYDAEGNLIGAFGGIGDQEGLFKIPTAISYNSKGELIILDSEKDTLTVMQPTEYAKTVFTSLILFQDGQYIESMEYLDKANQINPNYSLIYTGLGKANYMLGNYSIAMDEFKLGNNQEEYSMAKQANRNQFLSDNFVVTAIIVLILFIALVFFDKVLEGTKFVFNKIIKRWKK